MPITQGREFKCHQNILAGRSSVFDAMFSHDMEERRSSKVDIQDLDSDTVHDMIIYIYSGKVEKIDDKAPGLLSAAEKYDLKVRLKRFRKRRIFFINLSCRNWNKCARRVSALTLTPRTCWVRSETLIGLFLTLMTSRHAGPLGSARGLLREEFVTEVHCW